MYVVCIDSETTGGGNNADDDDDSTSKASQKMRLVVFICTLSSVS